MSEPTRPAFTPYYEARGKGCDEIVRCYLCRKLVTTRALYKIGMCSCGSSKVTEVRTLTPEERDDILSGKISFPDSDLFLAEFGDTPIDPEAE